MEQENLTFIVQHDDYSFQVLILSIFLLTRCELNDLSSKISHANELNGVVGQFLQAAFSRYPFHYLHLSQLSRNTHPLLIGICKRNHTQLHSLNW
jgi:hypothetical protein